MTAATVAVADADADADAGGHFVSHRFFFKSQQKYNFISSNKTRGDNLEIPTSFKKEFIKLCFFIEEDFWMVEIQLPVLDLV